MRYRYDANYLKELRQANKMTVKMLAERLDISVRHISRYESTKDICFLNHGMIIKYAEVFKDFDINKLYLVDNEEVDNNEEGDKDE